MLMDKEVTQITKEALIAISKYMLILIIFFYSKPLSSSCQFKRPHLKRRVLIVEFYPLEFPLK